MATVSVVTVLFGFFMIIFLVSDIVVSLHFRANAAECLLDIRIRFLYGLIRFRKRTDIKQLVEKWMENEEQTAEKILGLQDKIMDEDKVRKMKKMRPFVMEQFKKARIRKFVWRSRIGLDDAAALGTLCGAIWALKGMASAWLKKAPMVKCEPDISLDPSFRSACAATTLSCMVSIRTGKAIWTVLQFYLQWKKLQDRRTDDGASNQRPDDDGDGEFKGNDRCQHNRWRTG